MADQILDIKQNNSSVADDRVIYHPPADNPGTEAWKNTEYYEVPSDALHGTTMMKATDGMFSKGGFLARRHPVVVATPLIIKTTDRSNGCTYYTERDDDKSNQKEKKEERKLK